MEKNGMGFIVWTRETRMRHDLEAVGFRTPNPSPQRIGSYWDSEIQYPVLEKIKGEG